MDIYNQPKPSQNKLTQVRYRGRKLTDKQVEILELIAEGKSNSEIATILDLSTRAIEFRISAVRDLIDEEVNYRLGDRELVLFARDMLDGYNAFLECHDNGYFGTSEIEFANKVVLVEDWDDNDDFNPRLIPFGFKSFSGDVQVKPQPRKYDLKVLNTNKKIGEFIATANPNLHSFWGINAQNRQCIA